ncbi:MAG TPA: hypothetical protein VFI03_12220 [Solirubrobacterales bacterium]|nr:hypothetical protein [Solirubrobacterales bacterium]
MNEITITQAERNVLRRELSFHEGAFEVVLWAVRGDHEYEADERRQMELVMTMLDRIGWESAGSAQRYVLPDIPQVREMLAKCRDHAESNDQEPPELAATFDRILGRFPDSVVAIAA